MNDNAKQTKRETLQKSGIIELEADYDSNCEIVTLFFFLDHFRSFLLNSSFCNLETNNAILLEKERERDRELNNWKADIFKYFQSLIIIIFDSSYDDCFVVSYIHVIEMARLP